MHCPTLPLPHLTLRVNNRKLIEGFYRGLGASDPAAVIKAIDKLDKVSRESMLTMLADTRSRVASSRRHVSSSPRSARPMRPSSTQVRALGRRGRAAGYRARANSPRSWTPPADLNNEGFTVQASLSLARGLDYYTGTVFEIYMRGFESLGSVGGGGRYDALASDGKTTYPGVGISFGISRTLVPLVNRGLLTSSRAVPSAVLVALNDEDIAS